MRPFRGGDDVNLLLLYNTMYAAYYRRLGIFKHQSYVGMQWEAPHPLTIGAVDAILEASLPLAAAEAPALEIA